MAKLFQIVPADFFRPLTAPGAAVYIDVLLRLLEETQHHHQPLSHELAKSIVVEAIADSMDLSLTDDVLDEDTVNGVDELHARAGAILRYLERCGWLRSEVQRDFTQSLILPDYAFRLLRVLREIAGNEVLPLQGLICAIHDLLQAAAREGDEHIRLREAHRQTLHLINGLKELQHNIGVHIEQVLRQYETHSILEQLFLSYRDEIVDRAYHQLRTTDHVSRFRPGVLTALGQLLQPQRLESAAQGLFMSGAMADVEEAFAALLQQLSEVREQFEALDRVLQMIDVRHSQFVDAAVRKVELHLSASTTTSGQLHAILSRLLHGQAKQNTPDDLLSPERLISLFRLEWADQGSLSPPARAATPFVADPVPVASLSPDMVEAAQDETLRQLTRAVSKERIRRFARDVLSDRPSIQGSDIPLSGPEDLALLIYLRAYGDGTLGYQLEELPEGQWVERNGIGFRDFLLRQQGRSDDARLPDARRYEEGLHL